MRKKLIPLIGTAAWLACSFGTVYIYNTLFPALKAADDPLLIMTAQKERFNLYVTVFSAYASVFGLVVVFLQVRHLNRVSSMAQKIFESSRQHMQMNIALAAVSKCEQLFAECINALGIRNFSRVEDYLHQLKMEFSDAYSQASDFTSIIEPIAKNQIELTAFLEYFHRTDPASISDKKIKSCSYWLKEAQIEIKKVERTLLTHVARQEQENTI